MNITYRCEVCGAEALGGSSDDDRLYCPFHPSALIQSIASASNAAVIIKEAPRIYSMRDDQGIAENCLAVTLDDAREEARAWIRSGDHGEIESTIWLDVWIDDLLSDEVADKLTVAIDPPAPRCTADDGHDWQAPFELVGGIKSNPGVWGHDGGGVVLLDVCVLCGCRRRRMTNAARPDTGQRGLESLRYEPGAFTIEEIAKALGDDE